MTLPVLHQDAAPQEQPLPAFLEDTRARIHRSLLDRLDLSALARRPRSDAEPEVRDIVRDLVAADETPMNLGERVRLVEHILDDVFGLGPLEPLLEDPTISDILVNTHREIWLERDGRLVHSPVRFRDEEHLRQIIDRIVSAVGRRIDEASPMVDARLADGSRVNAIIPPLAVDGPHLSIRKFRRDVLGAEDLIRAGTMPAHLLDFLHAAVKARLNILISGGTGSGKTTFLNMLSEAIPGDQRIVTIEDSAELQLRQPHVVRLETRPPNLEGEGAIGARQLVINALRMRPDRIVIGEVRGGEALDMLQAMNTGHDGSLTTLHANTPRDALSRLETMASMAHMGISEAAIRAQIASALDLVLHVARLSDGTRKLMAVSEVTGMEGDIITMQDLFVFQRVGIRPEDGRVIGSFRATGVHPACADRLAACGIPVEDLILDEEAHPAGRWA
jgi:pilus assembly protein CpaF